MHIRSETLSNLAVSKALRTLGANSPITTPRIMAMRMKGERSLSWMLRSLNGAITMGSPCKNESTCVDGTRCTYQQLAVEHYYPHASKWID